MANFIDFKLRKITNIKILKYQLSGSKDYIVMLFWIIITLV